MAAVMIDTLKVSRRLRDAGAAEPLAEAMAQTLAEQSEAAQDQLATKADLEIAVKDLRAEMATTAGRLENSMLQLETRLLAAQNRLIVWLVGAGIATAGLSVALSKVL